jgi:hypothetical protein
MHGCEAQSHVVEIVSSETFDGWLRGLRDRQARAVSWFGSTGSPPAIRATSGRSVAV